MSAMEIWIIVTALALLAVCVANVRAFIAIKAGKRRRLGPGRGIVRYLPAIVLFYGWLGYCMYAAGGLVESDRSASAYWSDASASPYILAGVVALIAALFGVYLAVTNAYVKPRERPYATLLSLSVISGFSNACLIFIVNAAIAEDGEARLRLVPLFLLCMLLFVFGQKLLRSRLIRMTNSIVYEKRMDVLDIVLQSPYEKMEALERGKIETCLNNDTETISSFANKMVSIGTWSVTIIAGFVYLAVISLPGFLLSLGVVFAASAAFFALSRSVSKLWEQTRDLQNVFFKFIQDLTFGFKELYLHRNKAREFREDMGDSCAAYRDKRMSAENKIAGAIVVGDLLFAAVIGVVVFAFPLLFSAMDTQELRSFVFVFLYMAGPLTAILNALPELFQARVSWNRIRGFSEELSGFRAAERDATRIRQEDGIALRLEEATYEYARAEEKSFAVGPIDFEFRSGELVFIVGGNGSGKSTLAKLITGLYDPRSGSVSLNGERMQAGELGELVSTVFSDAYLFDRLYGIDFADKESEALHYLRVLGLQDKVSIQGGRFSTTRLSSGQRKRLALLVSYLDDKPICVFDEWAAEQDPDYRAFFYQELLPDLRSRGKCVIVITHDDRYFDLADRIIKLEMGKIA
ncbi:cyclic peptide export ABC transporter [Cohnella panacarvi]|uniref:cyclic peptide export ABC transporter n=1 Tax=Cohnella panacarvi TaxID=400776 RepID=UPI0004AFCB35|nr:cyclic peptide export ABC transporter [Cohnella panacarvi]